MSWHDLLNSGDPLVQLSRAKFALPVVLLTLLWIWETWQPVVGWSRGRLSHAAHNLLIAVFNTLVLSFAFGSATVFIANWTTQHRIGLLNATQLNDAGKFLLAVILLDGWMYVWHRANHAVPLLWRFHRMHHSDNHMDVTTATRFHLGEHVGSTVIRLGLIPLLGFQIWHIIAFELLVIANTQLHHADISLGRCDRWLRLVIVTPDMHKVHHSRWQVETDSNFSTLFSVWDRLARTFRMRADLRKIDYGLDGFDDHEVQTFWGMLKTPFVSFPITRAADVPRTDHGTLQSQYASSGHTLNVGETDD